MSASEEESSADSFAGRAPRRVICFGEALIDLIESGEQRKGSAPPVFRQYTGGAPANVAVAVAKLGGLSSFAGQVGDDHFGRVIERSLAEYDVDTSPLLIEPGAPTPLAFVSLDERGERSFSFYRNETADLLYQFDPTRFASMGPNTLFHFCSNTLTTRTSAEATSAFVSFAKECGAEVSFDVNLRHNLWSEGAADRALINQLASQVDVLKYAADELVYLSADQPQALVQQLLDSGVRLVVVTDGENAIRYFLRNEANSVEPPTVRAVDTTGAGDAFTGGFLFRLSQQVSLDAMMANDEIDDALRFAAHCGAIAVTRHGVQAALPLHQEVLREQAAE